MSTNQERHRSDIEKILAPLGAKVIDGYYGFSKPLSLKCKNGHCFTMSISTLQRGSWCRECSSTTELESFKKVLNDTEIDFETNFRIDNWEFPLSFNLFGKKVLLSIDTFVEFEGIADEVYEQNDTAIFSGYYPVRIHRSAITTKDKIRAVITNRSNFNSEGGHFYLPAKMYGAVEEGIVRKEGEQDFQEFEIDAIGKQLDSNGEARCQVKTFHGPFTAGRKTGIGYVRVSTEHQLSQNSISLENQEDKIVNYCRNNNINLKKIYYDRGISGKSLMNREALGRAIEELEHQDCLIVSDLSRFSRNSRDTIYFCDHIHEQKHAYLVLLDLGINTSDAHGKVFLTILSALAQHERETTSQRVKSNMNFKREKGESYGKPRYGYRCSEPGKPRVADEGEMANIEIMRSFVKTNPGFTYKGLSEYMNNKKIPTRKGGRWHPDFVKKVLIDNRIVDVDGKVL